MMFKTSLPVLGAAAVLAACCSGGALAAASSSSSSYSPHAQQLLDEIAKPVTIDDATLAMCEPCSPPPTRSPTFVDGAALDVYVREHKLDLRQRLQLFLQICDAVAYAHTNMVVHCDLKPGNVLVDRSGRPHLLDFGIAKPLQARIGSIDVEETGAAQRFFSPAHAAPEQLRDGL